MAIFRKKETTYNILIALAIMIILYGAYKALFGNVEGLSDNCKKWKRRLIKRENRLIKVEMKIKDKTISKKRKQHLKGRRRKLEGKIRKLKINMNQYCVTQSGVEVGVTRSEGDIINSERVTSKEAKAASTRESRSMVPEADITAGKISENLNDTSHGPKKKATGKPDIISMKTSESASPKSIMNEGSSKFMNNVVNNVVA